MRVFIALVLETYVCIFRRCMKSDSSDHPSVMFQVQSPWSLVLGLAALRCQVLAPRSQVQGPWSYHASSLRSHVSGARSQVSGPRVLSPWSQVPSPGSTSAWSQPRSQLLVLACDYWTDIQIMAGIFHIHDRKLLLVA